MKAQINTLKLNTLGVSSFRCSLNENIVGKAWHGMIMSALISMSGNTNSRASSQFGVFISIVIKQYSNGHLQQLGFFPRILLTFGSLRKLLWVLMFWITSYACEDRWLIKVSNICQCNNAATQFERLVVYSCFLNPLTHLNKSMRAFMSSWTWQCTLTTTPGNKITNKYPSAHQSLMVGRSYLLRWNSYLVMIQKPHYIQIRYW